MDTPNIAFAWSPGPLFAQQSRLGSNAHLMRGAPTTRTTSRRPKQATSMILRAPPDAMSESTERAEQLPWRTSVAGADVDLLFMPFLMHQLGVMRERLTGLKDVPFSTELALQLSGKRPALIESWQWESDLFRKVRLTYIDAGIPAQVFNSVWYPREQYDAPLLGIDFLSFGRKKVLCVLDFQPLSQDADYLAKYCEPIAYIKEKYEGLKGSMSKKFYNENVFFSKQLAFAKFDNSKPVKQQLFPAFKEYLAKYVDMVEALQPNENEADMRRVRQLHKEYDIYSAERDPAVGLFASYWGKRWANKFTHEFLFSDAEGPNVEIEDEEDPADKELLDDMLRVAKSMPEEKQL